MLNTNTVITKINILLTCYYHHYAFRHFISLLNAAASAICSHVKFASEISVLYLMETFCLPILSYSCEALCYNKQQLSQLNTCWNRAYRKIFKINDWVSVKEVQALCDRLDFNHIHAQRKLLFIAEKSKNDHDVLKVCYDNFRRSDECVMLQCEFGFAGDVFFGDVKDIVFKRFDNIAVNVL